MADRLNVLVVEATGRQGGMLIDDLIAEGHTGYGVDLRTLHKEYPGIPWRTTREWAGEQDWSWIQSPVALQ